MIICFKKFPFFSVKALSVAGFMLCGVVNSYGVVGISTMPGDTSNVNEGFSFIASEFSFNNSGAASSFVVGTPTDITQIRAILNLNTVEPSPVFGIYPDTGGLPNTAGSAISTFNALTPAYSSGAGAIEYTATCATNCGASNYSSSTKYWLVLTNPSNNVNWHLDISAPVATSAISWATDIGDANSIKTAIRTGAGSWSGSASEVLLFSVDVVPEAKHYAMIFGGLAVLFVAVRRRMVR